MHLPQLERRPPAPRRGQLSRLDRKVGGYVGTTREVGQLGGLDSKVGGYLGTTREVGQLGGLL